VQQAMPQSAPAIVVAVGARAAHRRVRADEVIR
jgi:hypothetical protein